MNATKMIALLLGVASVGLFMLFAFVAFAGPSVLNGAEPAAPWPLDNLSSGCLGLVMFCVSVPLSALPGVAGLSLWLFVIRKQDASSGWETLAGPEREAAFQGRLDGLTKRLLENGGAPSTLAPEIPVWTRDLDDSQKNRVFRLLAECGGEGAGPSIGFLPSPGAEARPPGWWARASSLSLLGFAAFCLLWGAFVVISSLTTNLGQIVVPGSTPTQAAAGSGGCFVIGLTALIAGLAVRWLARREANRVQQRTASLQRISNIVLESCLRQMERLLKKQNADALPPEAIAVRIARARVICTLPELDGTDKGRLIVWLHAGLYLSKLALAGADLRGARLAGTDLSAAALAGVDLSGASLSGANLLRADLEASRLHGADLRGADAGGINLRYADLRQARMHRCNLRQADLRGANLSGANLWRADLTDAQMDEDLTVVVKSQDFRSKEPREAQR